MQTIFKDELRYDKIKKRNGVIIFFTILVSGFPKILGGYEHRENDLAMDAYFLDEIDERHIGETAEASDSGDSLVCPSINVIRTRYKCRSTNNEWVDCTRSHCCPGFNFIGGKCLSESVDPCTLALCEQRCAVLFQRVICTCWDGYRFSAERQKRGEQPVCVEIDECEERTSDCDHVCINEPAGSFSCACNEGFSIGSDNKTCEKNHSVTERIEVSDDTGGNFGEISSKGEVSDREYDRVATEERAEAATRCYASCDTVQRLHDKVRKLQEKIAMLGTAIRLASYSSGAPGPMGPVGPPGPPGPRGFPGDDLNVASEAYSSSGEKTKDRGYSVLDSFVQTETGYCKCQRGPIGSVGPPGKTGPKGESGQRGSRGPKGAAGSFDFLLLLLADVRHDVVLLQEKVFQGETLPKFDFEAVLKKQKLSAANKENRGNHPAKRHRQHHNYDKSIADGISGSLVDDFETSATVKFTDYASIDEDVVVAESSGEEWEQYDD